MDCDVAIIGAGAAGIAAARALVAGGRSVVVIEASDRVGGRGHTVSMAGLPLDLGCGWLHSAERNPMVARAGEAGFAVDRSEAAWGEQWRNLGFSPAEQEAAGAAWDAFERRIHADPPPSDRAADALEPGGEWNGFCQALSGYLNGAPLDRLSVADFLAYDDAASEANWRVPDGYGALIAASLPAVPLRLATPVRRVALSGGGVRIDTPRGSLLARVAVVTVSTAVLASGVIGFDADVGDHLEAAARLPLGLANKLFLELVDDHGLDPESHLIGDPRDAGTGSCYIRPFGRPVVEAFFGGSGAIALEEAGIADAFGFAIDQLAALIGSDIRRHLRPLVGSAWGRADWIGGSYSHALPGYAGARAVLARPVEGRLFFAGEATSAHDFSTAHGAWDSGVRAAREVAAALA